MAIEILLTFLCIVASCVALFVSRKKPLAVPGPRAFPIFGNVLQMNSLNPHFTLDKWSKIYGGLFKFKIFWRDVLVVTDLTLIHEALLKRGHDFAGRPRFFRTEFITEGGKDIAFHPPNKVWKTMRKNAHKCVKMYDIGLDRIEEISMKVVEELLDEFKSHVGKPFNPKVAVYNSVMNIICLLLVGRKYSPQDAIFTLFAEVERLAMTTSANGGKGAELDVIPFLRFFGNSTYRQLKELRSKRKLLSKMLRDDVVRIDGSDEISSPPSLLNCLMDLRDRSPLISDEHVDCVAFDMILAGTSTTTNLLLCLLLILVKYPDVLHDLQSEVDSALGGRAVTIGDRASMPYMQATLLELLRYTSLLPLGLPHETTVDTQLGGTFVPEGTQVLFNLWSLHHDEETFPEPWNFKPSRFLDQDGNIFPVDHATRKHLKPFGAGPRVCFGEILARTRLFLISTTIVQRLDLAADETCEASCHPCDLQSGLVLAAPDFTLITKPR